MMPLDPDTQTWTAAAPLLWRPYLWFWAGYALIAIVPGPNMLLVSAVAAGAGMRRAGLLALCIGAGSGALTALLFIIVGTALPMAPIRRALDAVTPLLLGLIAWQIFRSGRMAPAAASERRPGMQSCLATGLATAMTNPVTAAYALAHDVVQAPGLTMTVSALILGGGVMLIAQFKLGLMAALMSHRRAQLWFGRHLRPLTVLASIAMLLMALSAAARALPASLI